MACEIGSLRALTGDKGPPLHRRRESLKTDVVVTSMLDAYSSLSSGRDKERLVFTLTT